MDVRIIYEDQEIIVVIKPAGMPSQSDRSMTMDMVSYLKNYLVPSVSGEPYIGVIHRLDRPVGGVMVYAKTPQAAKILSGQLQKKQIGKKYMAVLTGKLPNEEGTLKDWIETDKRTNVSKIVSKPSKAAKEAALNYRVIGTAEHEGQVYSLTDIELITGRHHQIRVQTAGAGAGIYGDTKYNPAFQGKKGWFDLGLFSYYLAFKHPKTGRPLTFKEKPSGGAFEWFKDGSLDLQAAEGIYGY